jgi:hypothetical protein
MDGAVDSAMGWFWDLGVLGRVLMSVFAGALVLLMVLAHVAKKIIGFHPSNYTGRR